MPPNSIRIDHDYLSSQKRSCFYLLQRKLRSNCSTSSPQRTRTVCNLSNCCTRNTSDLLIARLVGLSGVFVKKTVIGGDYLFSIFIFIIQNDSLVRVSHYFQNLFLRDNNSIFLCASMVERISPWITKLVEGWCPTRC